MSKLTYSTLLLFFLGASCSSSKNLIKEKKGIRSIASSEMNEDETESSPEQGVGEKEVRENMLNIVVKNFNQYKGENIKRIVDSSIHKFSDISSMKFDVKFENGEVCSGSKYYSERPVNLTRSIVSGHEVESSYNDEYDYADILCLDSKVSYEMNKKMLPASLQDKVNPYQNEGKVEFVIRRFIVE